MRRIDASNLLEGDILAEPIYDSNGLLCDKGQEVTETLKAVLDKKGILEVVVMDEYPTGDIKIEDMTDNQLKLITITAMKKRDIPNLIRCAKKIAHNINDKEEILFDEMKRGRNGAIVAMHAIKTCEYAVAVAKKLGITNIDRLEDVAVASLIGSMDKVFIDKRFIEGFSMSENVKKNCNVSTEDFITYERYMTPVYLSAWLRENKDINTSVSNAIITKNENVDGSGYPLSLTGSKIPLISRIIRVCSDYDSFVMESHMHPYNALSRLREEQNKVYDKQIVDAFIRTISFFPKGVMVSLNDGRKGIVVSNHPGLPNLPTVMLKDGEVIDLSQKDLEGNYVHNLEVEGTVNSREEEYNYTR